MTATTAAFTLAALRMGAVQIPAIGAAGAYWLRASGLGCRRWRSRASRRRQGGRRENPSVAGPRASKMLVYLRRLHPYGQKIHLRRFPAQPPIVSGGEFQPSQRELSQYLKYMTRTRISEFEFYHPSHAVWVSASTDAWRQRGRRCGRRRRRVLHQSTHLRRHEFNSLVSRRTAC